jgi:cytochrome c-type biogenesis protein CcmE
MEEKKAKKRRKLKPILISIIIILVIGYLIYDGMIGTMTYYLTVSEVLAKSSELENETIRMGGNVSPESVQWNPKKLMLLFKIEDDKSSISVDYRGVVPDSFKFPILSNQGEKLSSREYMRMMDSSGQQRSCQNVLRSMSEGFSRAVDK